MATGDGWMNTRLNLPCFSVPIVVLTILVVVGFVLFASGTIFTGIGYTKKKPVDDIRGTKFMRELGPALIVIGLLTTLLCAFAIYAARRIFSKVPSSRTQTNQPVPTQSTRPASSVSVDSDVPTDYDSAIQPINAARGDSRTVYQNISELRRYTRSYSNEPLEPIRPLRPSRRPRQPTPPEVRDEEVNEVPPSYDEVMSQVLHTQTL